MVGMVVAYNYQPRHNGVNIPLNLYFNYDQDEGHGGTVAELLSLFLTEPFLQKLYFSAAGLIPSIRQCGSQFF